MGISRQPDSSLIPALKQRMLARAAPRLAHDLNNDLTIIGGQAELAQRQGDPRVPQRMEQIKLAARRARERNDLIQELAADEADTGDLPSGYVIAGTALAEDMRRMAALLGHRDVTFTVAADTTLPPIDRTRLRWITGALLMAAQPCPPATAGTLSVSMTRGGGGLRMACRAEELGLPEWLTATLSHCATAADVSEIERGWQALILLAEAL